MKAAVYHGTRDVRIESFPDPGPPASGEVRLRVLRAAICGTDAGEWAHGPRLIPVGDRHPSSGIKAPLVLGHEFVGEVEAVGPGVDGLAVGDRVVPGAGQWCGSCSWCRAGRTNLCARYYTLGLHAHGGLAANVNVPARMCVDAGACDPDAAAIAQPLAVALHAIDRSGVAAGDSAVVIGVGGIGFFLVAGLLSRGVTPVVAVDIDDDKLARARRLGAHHVFNGRAGDLREQILAVTGAGAEVVFEAAGVAGSPGTARTLVRRGGSLVLVGLHHAPVPVDLTDLILREVDVKTSVAHICDLNLPEAVSILAQTGLSDVAIDRVIDLDDLVTDGLAPLAAGSVSGKVVVRP